MNKLLSRRTVLRGLGATIALPLLDAMVARLAPTPSPPPPAAAKNPVRMALFFVPNGVNMEDWTPRPRAPGDLPVSLRRRSTEVKDDLIVLTA